MGDHPDATQWPRIRQGIDSQLILDIRDDSHSPRVAAQLRKFKNQIDFAYIDGDHSYDGLRQDIILVSRLLRTKAFMALHDTLAVPDCRRVYEDLLKSSVFKHVRDFNSKFEISLWRKRSNLDSVKRGRYFWRNF